MLRPLLRTFFVGIASPMLQLSSTADLLAKLKTAREVNVRAYTIHGAVLYALEAAARRGAHVAVALEAQPYPDGKGHLAGENRKLVAAMRSAGIDASLEPALHAKTIDVDGALFLDEKNWSGDTDLVVRDDDPADAANIAATKCAALREESETLTNAMAVDRAIVESETFGRGNSVAHALDQLALRGASPRLLVSRRDLNGNARERAALERLARDGVAVRVCKDSAKLAVAGNRAWLGSANATPGCGPFDMADWGARTQDASIVAAVRDRLEKTWANAKPLQAKQGESVTVARRDHLVFADP